MAEIDVNAWSRSTPGQPAVPQKPWWTVPSVTLAWLENECYEYDGIFFDRKTGKTYYFSRIDSGLIGHRDDGAAVALREGFTFEPAAWWGSFMGQFYSGWLNPLGFATESTAMEVRSLLASAATATNLRFEVDSTQNAGGFFNRTIERRIRITNVLNLKWHEHSAGRIAVAIMREGVGMAALRVIDEARRAVIG